MTPGELAPAGTPYMAELLNETLGAGLYSVPKLLRDIADRPLTSSPSTVRTGWSETQSRACWRRRTPTTTRPSARWRRRSSRPGWRGSFEGLAVIPAARRQGIGSRLLDASMGWMAEQGARRIVALSWISRQASSAGLFVRAGFRAGPTVEELYLEESTRDGWTCPGCGGPCHCAAQFYWRATDAPSRA